MHDDLGVRRRLRPRLTGPQTLAIGATGYVVDVRGGMAAESSPGSVMFDNGAAILTRHARPIVPEEVTKESCEAGSDVS